MSHNVTMSNVQIKDLQLFGNIAQTMSAGAAHLDVHAKTFRTYRGQPTDCDAKISMPGAHDIGLKRNADGNYVPVFDPYNMAPIFRAAQGRNYIGALLREYAMQEAEITAAQQGMTTTRLPGKNGTEILEIVQT